MNNVASPVVESPLLNSKEAMAFFRIKDKRTFRRYLVEHKIPYEVIGHGKFFHKDVLAKMSLKIQEAQKRKLYE